jgi:decaprenyl-phosphate phosphoribosyltransferase
MNQPSTNQQATKTKKYKMKMTLTSIAPYVAIARFDHWFKNVFVVPGIIVAIYADHSLITPLIIPHCLLALLAMGFVASSYYVLNEILDAEQDRLHPLKKNRPIACGLVNLKVAYAEWLFFGVLGFWVASLVNQQVLLIVVTLWIMGCLYNIPPVRTKDKPYLDVLSESVNNPLRLMLGWYATGIQVLPPVSLVAAYWMVGAFFMAVKRFAEFRRINDPERAAAYRKSFKYYTEEKLLICITYYGVAFGLFFGIFLVRYRMELILATPLIAGFITWYIKLGFMADSPAQTPEKLFRQRGFLAYAFLCIATMTALLFVDVPGIERTFVPTIPTATSIPETQK